MAERYEDQYRRDRGYRPNDRGLIDRAGDEVRSWFGDDDAERRRQLDDRDRNRERGYRGNEPGYPSYPSYSSPNSYPSYGGADDRPSFRDRTDAFRDRGYGAGDRSSGGYSDRAFAGTYDDRGSWSPGQPDAGYRPDGWRGMNYSASPAYGNRDVSLRGDERSGRNFAGHGPRGYQRSDTRINEDVCDCLCDSADVDARNIDVSVSNGEVTLNGSVSDRDQKRRAEDLIEQVSGVREVHNNLRVGAASQGAMQGGATGTTNAANTTSSGNTAASGSNAELPGNVLGVDGGAPDRAASAGRR
jgi:osmotically-inducible protein OsmY